MKQGFNILSWFGLIFLFLAAFPAHPQSKDNAPQSKGKKWPKEHNDCTGNCFSAEVVSVVPRDGGCTDYEIRVSHDGSCRYGLSHLTVEMPCGYVRNVKAPGGCGNDFGKDPTTGLRGLKIDGPRDFGKGLPNSFTVKFTWCNSSACNSSDCWEPRVAFKAATCVDYDTARNSCQAPPLQATVQKREVSCFGNSDGSLSVAVEGGEGPYEYSWSTGCNSPSIDNLPVGTYTVTVTDTNGNTVTLTEEITAKSQIVLSASTVNPTCSSSTNGSIDLTAEGGLGTYSYKWSNGAASQDLTGLPAGLYQVTATDSTGCSSVASFQLTQPVISVSTQITQPSCSQSNGQIDITVTGGTEPYAFQWTNGATSQDLLNVSMGKYRVVVMDADLCSTEAAFLLREDNTLKISPLVTPTGCPDLATGAIDITVTGGTAPYTYLWSNQSTTEDLTGLSAGLQKITVTDAKGCTAISNINVFRQSFQVMSQFSQPSCSGQPDGSISLTPHGVAPFTYLWSTGATTSSIHNLAAGLYTVTVTDATGCVQVSNYFLSNPVINVSAGVSNPECGAEGSFSIDLGVTGGSAPYSYTWSNGETTEDLSGLNSGTYSVSIVDASGCTKVTEVVVKPVVVNWECLINPISKSPVCGSPGNTLSTSVAGATSYSWNVDSEDEQWVISSGGASPSIVFSAGGNGTSATFTLTITKDGCTKTCSYTLESCSPVLSCGSEITTGLTSLNARSNQTEETLPPTEDGPATPEFQLVVYPNPVRDQLHLVWTAETDEYVQIELADMRGSRIAELYSGFVVKGQDYRIEWNASNLTDPLYVYRYASGTRVIHGKILNTRR